MRIEIDPHTIQTHTTREAHTRFIVERSSIDAPCALLRCVEIDRLQSLRRRDRWNGGMMMTDDDATLR